MVEKFLRRGGVALLFGILGDLHLGSTPDAVPLPGGRQSVLLGALLMNPNRLLSQELLIRRLWGSERAPATAQGQLYKRVGEVRALLRLVDRESDLRKHQSLGYELRVDPGELDSLIFSELFARAEASRDEDEKCDLLRQALDLWRGPRPLANLRQSASWPDGGLVQRRCRAVVKLSALRSAVQDDETAVDLLSQAAADYPAEVSVCRALMQAYLRLGCAQDALAAYERYERATNASSFAQVDVSLRNQAYAISRGDAPSKRPVPQQVPRSLDLVARGPLLQEAAWLLHPGARQVAVLVISGRGGTGKSVLAERVAHDVHRHYPDGQLFARLRSAAGDAIDPREVLGEFLRELGAARIPESGSERAAAYRTLLAGRRLLIVLDDAVGEGQVRDLIPGVPGCSVIITSRSQLPGLAGAHRLEPLEPLEHAAAVELYRKVVGGSHVTLSVEEDASVDEVVRMTGGLPLAVWIAGSLRVKMHPRSTTDLTRRLAQQGVRGFIYDEYSLERTMGVGYDALGPDAQRLVRYLAVLALPEFPSWIAGALLNVDPDQGEDALSDLATNFLVEPVDSRPRYVFHDLTRDFAAGLADADGDDARSAVRRVYHEFLTLVRHAHRSLCGGDHELVHSAIEDWPAPADLLDAVAAAPLAWFEQERFNIKAAVRQCAELGFTDLSWDLAVSSHEFYTIRSYHDDWVDTHVTALAACHRAGNRRGEGMVLVCLGQVSLVSARRVQHLVGLPELRRAVQLADGDDHAQAIALRTLASALRLRGSFTQALDLFAEALHKYTLTSDSTGYHQTLRLIGMTHLERGDAAEARRMLERAERTAREAEDALGIAQSRYWLGQADVALGHPDRAMKAFAQVLAAVDEGLGRAYALHGVGDVAAMRGRTTEARRNLREAAGLAHDVDDILEGRILLSTAGVEHRDGRPGAEETALTGAVELFERCGAVHQQSRVLAALATLYTETDRSDLAQRTRLLIQAGPPADDPAPRPQRAEEKR
jgi:tetratricopeptide (TPR) repeat protein/DNA-binding SARP family transcriptional activator